MDNSFRADVGTSRDPSGDPNDRGIQRSGRAMSRWRRFPLAGVLPGMVPGATKRNVIVAVTYLFVLGIVLSFAPP